jgi:uncharacterized protein (DUF2141 family)
MLKMRVSILSAALFAMLPIFPSDAAIVGPDAAVCVSGNAPAVLIRVNGFRNRAGKLRARTFPGNNPSSWFDKRSVLKRTEIEMPAAGVIEICMPVPRPGGYVVDIRHDINNNMDTDRADGVGATGNPTMTMWDILLGRKPPASQVVVQVGAGVTSVTVNLKYAQGGSGQEGGK